MLNKGLRECQIPQQDHERYLLKVQTSSLTDTFPKAKFVSLSLPLSLSPSPSLPPSLPPSLSHKPIASTSTGPYMTIFAARHLHLNHNYILRLNIHVYFKCFQKCLWFLL